MLFEILAFTGILLFLYKIFNPYDYWKKKGYPYLDGIFPIGTWPTKIISGQFQGTAYQKFYNKLSPHPFGGIYSFTEPQLILRDPKLIKLIMVKDFSNFRSRFGDKGFKHDPLSQHLLNLENDLWKSVRVKLTPAFSSGKLKMMYSLFEMCSQEMATVLENSSGKEIDVKDCFARFTTDIISTCAFGLEINSISNPDNEFRKIGQCIFLPYISLWRKFMLSFTILSPSLFTLFNKIFKPKIVPKKVSNFLIKVIKDTIEYREKNNVKTNDFLNLLLEIKKKSEQNPNENDQVMDLGMIAAQCFVFFGAGFETSSSVQSFALYELALNQNIQNRLRKEIDDVLAKHDNKPTYEALQEMQFLDQVINETIRKYPTFPIITRKCTMDYKCTEFDLKIEKDQMIIIPVYALHHDPQYFPEPSKFDPDRFSDENKSSIVPFTFLPFGEGPRICIGMRFGMLQTKLGLVTALSRFNVSPSKRTPDCIKFVESNITSRTNGPIYLQLEKR